MLKRYRKNSIYLLIFIIPFFIFFTRSDSFVQLRSMVVRVTQGPIRFLSMGLFEVKKLLYYHRTFNEYRRLKKEVDMLRGRVIGQKELVRENARFEKLLEFKRRLVYSSIAAGVIGRSPSYWNASIVIDKGEKDGIALGMAVVTGAGIVGKIAEVGTTNSKVILLTDSGFSVAALVQRPGESVLVSGSLSGECRTRYIDTKADIRVGDQVITSKLSSSFPEGLLIGRITRVMDEAKGRGGEYVLRPSVSLSQLEEVLVIIK